MTARSRNSSRTPILVPALVLTLFTGCAPNPEPPAAAPERGPLFVEAREAGLDFVHFNGMTGEQYIIEMMGPGGALFDYDNDGDLDVYLPQGILLDETRTLEQATMPPRHELPLTDRLYRNDLEQLQDGSARLKFTDVTSAAGLAGPAGYTMGVATGDYDNDGLVDLYLTQMGPNQLLRNNGDGTFTDVTERSGTADLRLSIPAAFFDYDRDGHLDLYVGNYLDFRIATHKECFSPSGRPDYCGPLAYDPLPDRLFRNRGDGTFEDTTLRSGLSGVRSNALGAVVADLDLDGWLDLYVANDTAENHLWINDGDGTFTERALVAGCALNADGEPEGSMGVDAGDIDGDGDEDLFMTHMSMETNTLYRNAGDGTFEDATAGSGLGAGSYGSTGFGFVWFDYDNDGWLDAVVANGEIKTIEALQSRGDPFPLHQKNQLFRNTGAGGFEETTALAGEVFETSEVTRGLAMGDIDNDGDSDLLWINNSAPARLLINRAGDGSRWVGVRVVEGSPAHDAIGARVGLTLSDGRTLWRRVRVSGSYASANDPRVLFGLGTGAGVRHVTVRWPDGATEIWDRVEEGRYTDLVRGSGRSSERGP